MSRFSDCVLHIVLTNWGISEVGYLSLPAVALMLDFFFGYARSQSNSASSFLKNNWAAGPDGNFAFNIKANAHLNFGMERT